MVHTHREDFGRKGTKSKDEESSTVNCKDFKKKKKSQYQEYKEEAEI